MTTFLKLDVDYGINTNLTSSQLIDEILDVLTAYDAITEKAKIDLAIDLHNEYNEKRDSEKRLLRFCHTGC